MEEVYVKLEDINNFIKERNSELNINYLDATDEKTKQEFKNKLEEIHYLMEQLPKIVEPSLVFAEVENEQD